MEADDTLKLILPETKTELGRIFELSKELAATALQSLPFGSRASLYDLDIIIDGNSGLELTSYGYDVAFLVRQLRDTEA